MKPNIMWSVLALVVFLVVAATYKTAPMQQLDEVASTLLKGNELIGVFRYLANTEVMIAILLLLLIVLWWKGKYYKMMGFVVFTFSSGFALNTLMKNYFERPRPIGGIEMDSFSFPSGHAMLGIVYLLLVAMAITHYLSRNTAIKWPYYAAVILAFFIGLSRVAVDVHYMTDVIAGWSLGLAWLLLCVAIYRKKLQI